MPIFMCAVLWIQLNQIKIRYVIAPREKRFRSPGFGRDTQVNFKIRCDFNKTAIEAIMQAIKGAASSCCGEPWPESLYKPILDKFFSKSGSHVLISLANNSAAQL